MLSVAPARSAALLPVLRIASSLTARHGAPAQPHADLHSEALLAFAESQTRFEPERGVMPTTYAYLRMHGRAIDAVRREIRHRELCRSLTRTRTEDPTQVTGLSSRLDLRQALREVGPTLSSAEKLVLEGHYAADAPLADLARRGRHSEDQLHRAHRALLRRLRDRLA